MSKKQIALYGILGVLLLFFVFFIIPFWTFITRDLKIKPIRALLGAANIRRVNSTVTILLLGVPGEPHDGPYLSDSINVLSYDLDKNRIAMINVPRDVWSSTLEDKINSAYAYGKANEKSLPAGRQGGGMILAQAEVGSIVGFPISYSTVVNFAGFQELIDFLGGVDVTVERSFTDKKYPVPGKESAECLGGPDDLSCRYQTVSFHQGHVHMDGDAALKFVRSRNAEGAEGSDFARGRRQEKVLEAVKGKVTKIVLSANTAKLKKLYELSQKILTRNIDNQQFAYLVSRFVLKRHFYAKSFSLPTELFEVPPVGDYGRYVLVPRDGFSNIHGYVSCILEKEDQGKCLALYHKSDSNQ